MTTEPTLWQAIDSVLVAQVDDASIRVEGKPIRLEESDAGSSCPPVTLRSAGAGQVLVLKPDVPFRGCSREGCQFKMTSGARLFPLFRREEGLLSICDYVVICLSKLAEEPCLFVLLCELKSGNIAGARHQQENTALLIEYVVAMARYHFRLKAKTRVEHRGIVFSPKFKVPKGNLVTTRCNYTLHEPRGGVLTRFAYYASDAEYPLVHFCT